MTMLALPPPGPPSIVDGIAALRSILASRAHYPGAGMAERLLRFAERELSNKREGSSRHALKRARWWLEVD